ncbi:PIG-L family deacetylase [Paenibacillus glycanilyticus]|uniref:PIG-L family deacetylase n=1 Tax=Paenibacillus glycanilyticus TaxID=126569 RepID=UPI00203B4229|nr:PIG-L family deacetylase [Paenibacillus glycanilyticus]MCM3626945.1 PIG-L family deacetylase [Paenibacillus glycanilyticus]
MSTEPRKLLAVFAHPDDESFICGGTLAKYASSGVEITLVSATRGEMGRRMGNPPYLNRETMAEARELELREACKCLGISQLHFFDIRDKTVEFADPDQLADRIAGLIKEVDPDVILTFHEQWGGHPDHCAIGKSTVEALERTGMKKALYYISFGDSLAYPESFGYTREDISQINVSKFKKAKLAAFRAHRCQTEIDEWVWLPDKQAMNRFGDYEYFIKGNEEALRRDRNDLF